MLRHHPPRPEIAPDTRRADELRQSIAQRIVARLPAEGAYATTISGLTLFRRDGPGEPDSALYPPSITVVIKGRKRAILVERELMYDAQHYLMTSVDLPTLSHVIEASPEQPFLSLMIELDLQVARELVAEMKDHDLRSDEPAPGMMVGPMSVELLDAIERLTALADQPEAARILAPLVSREITFRLIAGPIGGAISSAITPDGSPKRIADVISWLRQNYARSVRVEQLAEMAMMGTSTFHRKFLGLTGMSPLQYHKRVRLHEARMMLLTGPIDVTSAALRVGYESANQFNREYRRAFGKPPRRDAENLRALTFNRDSPIEHD